MAIDLIGENISTLNKRFSGNKETIQIDSVENMKEGNRTLLTTQDEAEVFTGDRENIIINNMDESAYNISYVDKYDSSPFSSRGLTPADYPEATEVTRADAENRISKVSDRLGIFLYNLFPYETMSAIGSIENLSNNKDAGIAIAQSAFTTLAGLSKIKYFTPAELALILGHNFYTLSFFRGVTAKKGRSGRINSPAGIDDVWTGAVDIYYGRDTQVEAGNALIQYTTGARDIAESANPQMAEVKEAYSPKISLTYDTAITESKSSFVDQLSSGNAIVTNERDDLLKSVLMDQLISTNDKKGWQFGKEDFIEASKKDQQYRNHQTDAQEYLVKSGVLNILQRSVSIKGDKWSSEQQSEEPEMESFDYRNAKYRAHETSENEYIINREVLKINQRANELTNGVWSSVTEEHDYNSVLNRARETNGDEYLIDNNVLDITQRVNVKKAQEGGKIKWAVQADPSQQETESFEYKNVLSRPASSFNDSLIDRGVFNIKLRSNPRDEADEGNINGTMQSELSRKGFTKRGGAWQIGAIYAIPVGTKREELPPFYLPFEFNPDISENSVDVKYEQTEILSRIGALHTFTGVGSLSVSITAKYFAVSHDGTAGLDSVGHGWMSDFTMEKIQAIEFGYRALALPHFPDEQTLEQGYKYIKPPLIKVIMGDYSSPQTAPYSNLLTYQTSDMTEGRLKSNFETEKKVFRTFIATGVTIKKSLEETPIYLDENLAIRDTFGFEVSLALTEVTPNYLDALPDYKNYYNQFIKGMGESTSSR